MHKPNATYSMKTVQYNPFFEDYTDFEKTHGHFTQRGDKYVVTNKNTPRQWLNFLVNDNFGSVVANDGAGYIFYGTANRCLTKYYSETDYLLRTLNGKRRLILTDKESGKTYDIFKDCENLRYTVCCGSVLYEGSIEGVRFQLRIFVPLSDCCECWIFSATSVVEKEYTITVGEDFVLSDEGNASVVTDGAVYIDMTATIVKIAHKMRSVFSLKNATANIEKYDEQVWKQTRSFARVSLHKDIWLNQKERTEIVLAGGMPFEEREKLRALVEKYTKEVANEELQAVEEKWEKMTSKNVCVLPDKNLQHFLNYWLKNQIYMTMRYNRCDIMGYRDVMQDAWGNLLVNPVESKRWILEGLSRMHQDGHCPRQYDRWSKHLDDRDFMDSPIWAAIAVVDYVKETGDFDFLNEKIGYVEEKEEDSVLEHILLAFDFLWNNKGKNGLLLMREGDWLDGLSGIHQYGEATTVWGTIAVYYAQNLLKELFERLGDKKNAKLMKIRSTEYKRVVNEVGWDGDWYAYAFIDDEPIGSKRCHEGKIYLNAQTWAMLSGIYDDEKKLQKMYRAIHTYLSTMYGPLLLSPAYQRYGEKCGRVQGHKPGTFSNAAIYLHGASFKVAGDCAVGNFDEALDTFQRILPNHYDSSDCRRTSEPYAVGNVYFGVEHECFGLNLYTWFTATPSWLIHCGFESLLGVRADFDGIRITPRDIDGWDNYSVEKEYKHTRYEITFKRGEEKGIWLDGKKIKGNLVCSEKEKVTVLVVY